MKYRHYKGNIYHLISRDILHTETNELMVYYINDNGDKFIRPQKMFDEHLSYKGKIVKRFTEMEG